MDNDARLRKWLEKEKKRLIIRKSEVAPSQELESLSGSLLTINKILNYLDNLKRDHKPKPEQGAQTGTRTTITDGKHEYSNPPEGT